MMLSGVAPRVFVIGAGPVAIALAGALRRGGVPVLGLWARRLQAARRAGDIAGVLGLSGPISGYVTDVEAIILAVRDGAIGEVAESVIATGLLDGRRDGGPVLLHCSGARPAAEALAQVWPHGRERGCVADVATLHPLRALADGARGILALPGTVFGVEGGPHGVRVARALVRAIGGIPLVLTAEQMAAYHAAAAMASNYLVALMDAAAELLASAGMDRKDALTALLPLADGSLANIAEKGVVRGLTGPIRRADVATVARHLASLRAHPELLALYCALGLRTVTLARAAHQEVHRVSGRAVQSELDAIEQLLRAAQLTS